MELIGSDSAKVKECKQSSTHREGLFSCTLSNSGENSGDVLIYSSEIRKNLRETELVAAKVHFLLFALHCLTIHCKLAALPVS